MVIRNWILLGIFIVSAILISGCTEIPALPGTPAVSPANQCNAICTELGYENWALLALVDTQGQFECKCTFLDCKDTPANGAIVRTCTPTSHIYPIE